jgi:hypothetical protein
MPLSQGEHAGSPLQSGRVGNVFLLPTKTFKDLRIFIILHEMVGKQKNVCPPYLAVLNFVV